MVAWKRGIAILSAGSVKVTPDPRVRLVNGYSLQIKDAVPQDAGDYVCQIATLEPREITHTVEILGKSLFGTIQIPFIFMFLLCQINCFYGCFGDVCMSKHISAINMSEGPYRVLLIARRVFMAGIW